MISGHEYLRLLAPYKPGATEDDVRREYGLTHVTKLASNENPYGASPLALQAAAQALTTAHRYADGGMALREKLASRFGVSNEQVTVHNGSDALIHQIMHTFLLPGETALSCSGGFISFGIAVCGSGSTPVFVPQAHGYRFDVEALASAVTPQTKVVYVPNPNNPTGTHLTRDELVYLADRIPSSTILVLDEAYTEYAQALAPDTYVSGVDLGYSNILTLRTFSKAYGLAAFRIGYAIGSAEVVSWLLKSKLPFDPSGIGCAAAMAALDDVEHVARTVSGTVRGMELISGVLKEHGYTSSLSVANFVFVDFGTKEMAAEFHLSLLHAGFITRPLSGFGLPTAVRITIGTPEQNRLLAETLAVLSTKFVSH